MKLSSALTHSTPTSNEQAGEAWGLSKKYLREVTPKFPDPYVNPLANDSTIMDDIIASLQSYGVIDPSRSSVEIQGLRDINIVRFVGYYVPAEDRELFILNARWMALLWLIDDTLDKARSRMELENAISINRKYVISVCETMRLSSAAPPVAAYLYDFCKELKAFDNRPVVFQHFQRTASNWTHRGSFKLAECILRGEVPPIEQHIKYRRWDSAADSCVACMEYCFPRLPESALSDSTIEEARRIVCTHIGLLNDIISYEQEVAHSVRNDRYRSTANVLSTIIARQDCSVESACMHILERLAKLASRYDTRSTKRATETSCSC